MTGDRARVAIIDQNSGKKYTVILPTGVSVRQLLPALVKQMGLPSEGSGGVPMGYALTVDTPEGRTKLGEDDTLAETGVGDGASLRITPKMTGGGSPSDEMFPMAGEKARVTIVDQIGGTETDVLLPTDIPLRQLLPALVEQLGLPSEGHEGKSVVYQLDLRTSEGGNRLAKGDTLAAAGVEDGAVMAISPEMTAGCFPAGLQITLPGSEHLPIESLRLGDDVLSYAPATGMSTSQIVDIYRGVEHSLLIVNGTLRITPLHLVYVHGVGWQRVAALRPGDHLQHESGNLVVIESIVSENGDFDVYNLNLDNNKTFFAAGFLVHNLNYKRLPLDMEFHERMTRERPEAEIDLTKIMITEALLAIQKYLVENGWSLGGKRTIDSGEVQHARRTAPHAGNLDLYILATPAEAHLQLFVADVQPDCRLGLYKYLLALNDRRMALSTRWSTDAHDQVFVQVFVGAGSSAEDIQTGVKALLAEFEKDGAEAAALAQEPRLADLVLQYGRTDAPAE